MFRFRLRFPGANAATIHGTGAGHDLRGATHYLGTRIRELHYALQCLIDYKGFRMTAQVRTQPPPPETLYYGIREVLNTGRESRLALSCCPVVLLSFACGLVLPGGIALDALNVSCLLRSG